MDNIKEITNFVLEAFKKGDSVVEVSLVDRETMRALNKKWRGKDSPTNVLSFNQTRDWPESGKKCLGEVFLAPQYIKEHKEDLEFLLIHGLLHILGFDHEKKGDRIRMEYHEKELLSKWRKNHLPV